jgi:hypothetical protein
MAGNCDLILCAFLHFTDELPAFGCEVIRLLREERVGAAVTQDSAPAQKSWPDFACTVFTNGC